MRRFVCLVTLLVSLSAVHAWGAESPEYICALQVCREQGISNEEALRACVRDQLTLKSGGNPCDNVSALPETPRVAVNTQCEKQDWRCRNVKLPPVPAVPEQPCCPNSGVFFGIGPIPIPNFVGAMSAGD